jgi:transcriptional regulator with XRE-family HTH domain
MASLSSLVAAKIKSANLNAAAAAAALDVSAPSLRSVLAGKAVPNSRSLGKYAKFLGISEDAVLASAGTRGGKAPKAKASAKAAGAKPRGRPPGAGNKAKAGAPAKEPKAPKAAKSGKGPGRPKLPGVAKATLRLLTASVDSIQKRAASMLKVIAKIQ